MQDLELSPKDAKGATAADADVLGVTVRATTFRRKEGA